MTPRRSLACILVGAALLVGSRLAVGQTVADWQTADAGLAEWYMVVGGLALIAGIILVGIGLVTLLIPKDVFQ